MPTEGDFVTKSCERCRTITSKEIRRQGLAATCYLPGTLFDDMSL